MDYEDVVRDFAERTYRNLEVIEQLARQGNDVYETTQLVNSLLGLLVFPQQRYFKRIPAIPLQELELRGWPLPKVTGAFAEVADLRQLMRYLRNAISHFNVEFIRGEDCTIGGIKVWNWGELTDQNGEPILDHRGRPRHGITWAAELRIDELRGIAKKFIELLLARSID
jgi:hypothetical protein